MHGPHWKILSVLATSWFVCASSGRAEITLLAWYRMGEADPGAAAKMAATNPTVDSTGRERGLLRLGAPFYSANTAVPGSSLAMVFRPAAAAGYYSPTPIIKGTDNFGVSCWVKARSRAGDEEGRRLVWYNGFPMENGFGLRQTPDKYEVVFTRYTTVAAAPAVPGRWTHLAYIRSNGVSILYVNGVPYPAGPVAPLKPKGKVMVGATVMEKTPGTLQPGHFFDGEIDELRFFTFRPGAFDPATDLGYSPRKK